MLDYQRPESKNVFSPDDKILDVPKSLATRYMLETGHAGVNTARGKKNIDKATAGVWRRKGSASTEMEVVIEFSQRILSRYLGLVFLAISSSLGIPNTAHIDARGLATCFVWLHTVWHMGMAWYECQKMGMDWSAAIRRFFLKVQFCGRVKVQLVIFGHGSLTGAFYAGNFREWSISSHS